MAEVMTGEQLKHPMTAAKLSFTNQKPKTRIDCPQMGGKEIGMEKELKHFPEYLVDLLKMDGPAAAHSTCLEQCAEWSEQGIEDLDSLEKYCRDHIELTGDPDSPDDGPESFRTCLKEILVRVFRVQNTLDQIGSAVKAERMVFSFIKRKPEANDYDWEI